MKLWKSKHSMKYRITRLIFLLCYIACVVVLTVEAATPKDESSSKSNAVGGAIETIINDINGDTAKEIVPTGCFIKNTKFEYNVGDSAQLQVVTEPSDATHLSYAYSSNDSTIARINATGEISFLKEGEAVISATNTKYTQIKASATFTVHNVHVRSFTSTIDATLDGDVYLLQTSSSYLITNTFVPSNATFKDVTYEYNASNGFIQIVDDTILALEESVNEVIEVKVKNVDFETPNILKIKTFTATLPGEDYPLQAFKVANVTKYIDQTSKFTPKVSYVPSYTSEQYRPYTLTSSDSSVVAVDGVALVPQGKIGSSNITVTSNYNPAITASFKVTIADRATLNSVSITKYSPTMYLGNTQKLAVATNPGSNVLGSGSFISSTPAVASVDGSGKVTALSIGTTTITYKYHDKIHNIDKQASVNIEVVQAPSNVVSDIIIDYKQGNKPIIYSDETVDLTEYFGISNFVGNETPTSTSYTFYVESAYAVQLSKNKLQLTPNMIGELSIYLEYTNEVQAVISKELDLLVISRFFITHDEIPVTEYDIDVGYSDDFVIESDSENYGQKYLVETDNDVFTIASDGDNIHAYATKGGDTVLSITPYYEVDNEKYYVEDEKVYFELHAKDIYTSTLAIKFTNNLNEEYEIDEGHGFTMYMNDVAKCNAIVDEAATRSNVIYESDNDNISIRNGVIKPLKIGDSIITVTDTYSRLTRTYRVRIRNKVIINENSVFTISGVYEYDPKTNTLTIINGNHAKIVYNFVKGSTLKATTYTIADEKIATVGADGNITPISAGKTVLTMEVKDELGVHITSNINLVINRKNFIQNVTEFMRTIRKLVGHFGAFALLGIFSTLTYFMFFRKKLFLVGVAINFSTAFGFAAFTEWVQTMTPGRAGRFADVLIDYYGFLLTAVTITLVIALIWLAMFLVGKYKKNKASNITSGDDKKKQDNMVDEDDFFDVIIGPEEKKE